MTSLKGLPQSAQVSSRPKARRGRKFNSKLIDSLQELVTLVREQVVDNPTSGVDNFISDPLPPKPAPIMNNCGPSATDFERVSPALPNFDMSYNNQTDYGGIMQSEFLMPGYGINIQNDGSGFVATNHNDPRLLASYYGRNGHGYQELNRPGPQQSRMEVLSGPQQTRAEVLSGNNPKPQAQVAMGQYVLPQQALAAGNGSQRASGNYGNPTSLVKPEIQQIPASLVTDFMQNAAVSLANAIASVDFKKILQQTMRNHAAAQSGKSAENAQVKQQQTARHSPYRIPEK
jgi:hypothetical protein